MVEAGYLLASNPELAFDIESTVIGLYNVEEFLTTSEVILPVQDAEQLRIVVESPADSSLEIAQLWHAFVESIKNESARIRWLKVKKGVFPQSKATGASTEAIRMASSLTQSETPLVAQLLICKTLWDKLDDLDSHYQNTIENVAVYVWKLQILSNLVEFRKELGKKIWENLVMSITEQAGFSPTAISGG